MTSPWDDMARAGQADDNMCHLPTADCLRHLSPILHLDPPGHVLDLGSGVGRLTKPVSTVIRPHNIYGVDASEELIAIAHERWQHDTDAYPNAFLYHNDGHTLPPLPELAGAFSIGMFQHVNATVMQSYIAQVANYLRHGGVFVYQFVYEGESGPLSFIHDYDEVRQWSILPVTSITWDKNDKWCWITSVKP